MSFFERGGVFAALDLGTTNCRLLVARPAGDGMRVIDSFSRIVRLGEGLEASGLLSEAAMERAIDDRFLGGDRFPSKFNDMLES